MKEKCIAISSKIEECLGRNLREKRKKLKFTLIDVAKKIGISYQQMQKYEQMQSKISASTLYRIARLYGVSIDQFFAGLTIEDELKDDSAVKLITETTTRTTINLILVEDNPGDEAIARQALGDLDGVNMLCVHDGVQALEVLRYKTLCTDFPKPDLILLDVGIPKKDGLSLLKDIKRDRNLQNIQVVMLTNNINYDIMMEAYKNGASGYICKSFDYNTFKAKLCDCVQYWKTAVVLPNKF